MDQIAGRPYWPLQLDASGVTDADGTALPGQVAAAGISDLFVLSHGWGTSRAGAHALYQALFPLIADAAAGHADRLPAVGFVGVFWPSLWFPDDPPAGQARAVAAPLTGADISAALLPGYPDDRPREDDVQALGALLDEGRRAAAAGADDARQEQLLHQFHALLPRLVTAHPGAVEDAGEWAAIVAADPRRAYAYLADASGAAPAGDAQGLGDLFGKVWTGAKEALRVASYYEMKGRAGDVGRRGLGPLLTRATAAAPGLRVHLVGHSFGARLVSFALTGLDPAAGAGGAGGLDGAVASLTLLQGAFSHWSFAPRSPFGDPGALAAVADRVAGPLVATYSTHDWAVGRWYPRASMLAGQDSSADGGLAERWGGLGGDGFQGVGAAALTLGRAGALPRRGFCSVDGQYVIQDVGQSGFAGAHSDICHPPVAQLIAAAALAGRS